MPVPCPSPPASLHVLDRRTAPSPTPRRSPVVFVHGFLVDSTLWDGVAELLAAAGVRSYLVRLAARQPPSRRWPPTPTCHRAASPGSSTTFLDALWTSPTSRSSATTPAGRSASSLLDPDATRIGRVVLTNCDAFENFPPKVFVPLFVAARHPGLTRALLHADAAAGRAALAAGLRPAAAPAPGSRAAPDAGSRPAMTDRRIRHDIARFARGIDRKELVDVASRLARVRRSRAPGVGHAPTAASRWRRPVDWPRRSPTPS